MGRINDTGQGELEIDAERFYEQPVGQAAPQGTGYAQCSSLSEDWYTHHSITDLVRELYDGVIDLDPMSCIEANRDYVKAEDFYTAHQDGLRYEWCRRDGQPAKVFLNPPWGGGGTSATKVRAIKKAMLEYSAGRMRECVLVLNSNTTTNTWFEPLFQFPICFPPRRIPHVGPGGKKDNPNSGTIIIYMGPRPDRFAEIFSRLGNVVHLYRPAHEVAKEAAVGSALDI